MLQETSEDEEGRLAAGQRSLMDVVELHTDSEDDEAYALLDRERPQRKRSHSGGRDKRKFNKILSRKDEQLRALTEKVQKQAEGVEDATSFMAGSEHLTGIKHERTCLPALTVSLRCIIICVVVVIAVPLGIAVYSFIKGLHIDHPSTSTTTLPTILHPDTPQD